MASANLQFDVSALDSASKTFVRLSQIVERFERRLDEIDGKKVQAEVDVKVDKAEREVGQFARDLQRRIGAAVKALPDIELDADSSDAQREVARIRKDLAELASKRIGVDIDAADAEARLAALRDTLRRIGDESVDVEVRADTAAAARAIGELTRDVDLDIDTAAAERKVGAFATDLQRRIRHAIESLPELEITADSSDAQRELAAIRADMAALGDKRIGIDLDAAEAQTQVADLQARLTKLAASSADVQVKADASAAVRDLAAVSGQVDELNRKTATVKVKVDRSLSESIVQVAALGRALGALAVPVALAAAVPQLAGLGAAAVSASGSLLLIPAAGAAAAASVAALTVGLHGFGDAMSALAKGDAAKFAEALKGLSPNAQQAATAIQGLGKSWREVQQATQQALFAGTADVIRDLGGKYLPILKTGLTGIATELNGAGKEFATFLGTARTTGSVATIFDNTAKATKALAPGLVSVGAMLRDIATVGSTFLPGLADGFSRAAERAAEFIAKARDTGQLAAWIQRGIDTVKQLGRIVGDVGASLMNIFGAADAAGVSFLGTVERITQGIRDFTSSAEGQQTIVAVFTGLREVVDAVWPGIERLAVAVGNVIQKLQEAGVFRQLGEAFTSIANGAAPVIELLGTLAAAVLPPLLSVAAALGPALGPIAVGLLAISAASKGASAISAFASGLTLVGRGADDAKTKGGGLPAIFGGIGKSADDADKKTRKLGTGLKLLAIPVGLAAGGAALAAIGDAAETSGGKVDGLTEQVGDLGLAMQQVASFDFAGIFSEIGSELDMMATKFQTGESAAGRLWGELERYVTGFEMQPVEIAINANTSQATAAAEQMLGQIDGSLAHINVDGNTLPAGAALQRVLADVAAGKAEIEINGNKMPAMEAVAHVIGLINNGAGEVMINGNPVPAGKALATVLGQVDSAHAMIKINGDTLLAGAALQKVIGEINAGAAWVSIDGKPMKAEQALAAVLGKIDISQAQVTINGQSAPAQAVLDAYLAAVASKSPTVMINGNAVPAQDVLNAFIGIATGTTTTSTHNANIEPAKGSVGAFVAFASGSASTGTHDANTQPAIGSITGVVGFGNSSSSTGTHNVNSGPARAEIGGVISLGNSAHTRATHTQGSNIAQVRGEINSLNGRATHSTHTIHVRTVGGSVGAGGTARGSAGIRPAGGAVIGYARGGIVPGYQPGRDTVPALLSRGEAVLVPELVRQIGAKNILAANKAASGGRATWPSHVIGRIPAAMRDGARISSTVRAIRTTTGTRSVATTGSADRMTVLAQQSGQAQQVLLQLGPVVAQLRALQAAVRSSVPSNLDVVDELRALQGAVLSLRRASAAGEARGARLTAELGATW